MWLRPDAITVWRNPEVVRRLSWYRSVMLDEKPAKFMICKHVGLDEDPSCLKEMREPELWSLHDRLAQELRKAHESIREGSLSLKELEKPRLDFLRLKAELAERMLRSCRFCVRRCGVDRTSGQKGFCGLGREARVSTWFHHYGEEAPLLGGGGHPVGGSGTIFFTSCNLRCVFCVAPESMVILDTWVAKPLADVKVGDKILSVSFPAKPKKQLKLTFVKVLAKFMRKAEVYRVRTTKGDIILTAEHPILDYRRRWLAIDPPRAPVKATLMKEGMVVRFTVKPESFVEDEDYMRGYLTGAIKGDGTMTFYTVRHGGRSYVYPYFNFVVKDSEFLNTVRKYLALLGVPLETKNVNFGNSIKKGLVSTKWDVFHRIEELTEPRKSLSWYRGFLAGFFDAEGSLSGRALRIPNKDEDLLDMACKGLDLLGIPYVYECYENRLNSIRIGRGEHIAKFFMRTHPKISRKLYGLVGRAILTTAIIEDIELLGEMPVFNLETENNIFICEGFITHNCQNHDISFYPENGVVVDDRKLAAIEATLRREGAANINLVGGEPTPNLHVILASLVRLNVNVPILWNSNMLCSPEAMRLLVDVVDIWLPDFKFGNNCCADRLTAGGIDYVGTVLANLKLAQENGDMIIRHLVMPNHVECCTKPVLDMIARELDKDRLLVNIMGQYRPEHLVARWPEKWPDIARRPNAQEMHEAFDYARELGILFEPVS
ncbi:hypothetical protein B6U66_01680 [Candidatus Bathyarchaeota archaeon ex4484_135]|nr:MAG: hypothetical protein B6U66_01680 [Candidatus Bathyarchaeota archaeon ex4484_135]